MASASLLVSGLPMVYPPVVVASSPVAVPSDFVGIHSLNYPGGPSPANTAPSFAYGAIRTHDSRIGGWRGINTANGVYDWSILDSYVGVGKPVMFTVFHTPRWAAKTALQDVVGPYGNQGECAPPQSLASLSTFITALVTRYGMQIPYIEVWNEPNFYQNNTGFFWGSAAEMVDMAATIYAAAKAVNPAVKVLSPGFILTAAIPQFLNTQGPSTGKYGREVIDGFCWHPYYNQPTYQACTNIGSSVSTRLGDVRKYLAEAGIDVPLYVSEYAPGVSPTDDAVLAFKGMSAAERKTWLKRIFGLHAALGVKHVSVYSYAPVSASLTGDLVADTQGVVAALEEVSAALPGKTIKSATQAHDGTLTLEMASGTTHIW